MGRNDRSIHLLVQRIDLSAEGPSLPIVSLGAQGERLVISARSWPRECKVGGGKTSDGLNHCRCDDPMACYHAMWDGHMCFKSATI